MTPRSSSSSAAAGKKSGFLGAMTVDVEEFFHAQALSGAIRPEEYDGISSRVEPVVDKILELFAATHIKATFFVLGWVAERHRAMVRRIASGGHELASHGYNHARVDSMSPREFRLDVRRTSVLIEDISGAPVLGYRAPTFSINSKTPWAYDILAEEGHRYSSSIYPVRHDLYGAPDAEREPYRDSGSGLWEFPMTTLQCFGRNIPISGGGYFRLLPYPVYRSALRIFNARGGQGAMFYFHPWEIDADQPRIHDISHKNKLRHYINLGRNFSKISALVRDFAWDRVDRIHAQELRSR